MADPAQAVAENVPGDFFVDASCIDCDTCRQLAPRVFGQAPDTAFVERQPVGEFDRRAALHALLSCPTGSIGSRGDDEPAEAIDDFPLVVDEPVYYCGFNSRKSYGGASYFLRRADGNWLIDSPRYLPRLVRKLEAMGGVQNIFLTHRDDVADARQFAEHFGARRVIHRRELAAQPDAELVLDGEEPQVLATGVTAVPTPGHTAGHMVLAVDDRILFTGDHLDFDSDRRRLAASRDYCWYSWPRQTESMRRLVDVRFEWVLPGHGRRVWLPAEEMRRQLVELVAEMEGTPGRR
jgi:glyoxylase-like metal-dependent hydrolase (beta-lactamase superfamily II)/ferredoxin